MVSDQMPLIQDVQTDAWWQDVTTPMLEAMPSFLAGTLRSSMS
jgi:type I restriction enzyme R subunit